MSMISAFYDKARNYAEAFRATDITSAEMKAAIREWFGLYYAAEAAAMKEEDPCQQIPYTIVRKLKNAMFAEYRVAATDDYAASVLKSLGKRRREEAVQKMLIGGEALLKPVPMAEGWAWVVIPRNAMLIFGRDENDAITDVGTVEASTAGRYHYTLLERRTVVNGYLTIRNMLFQSEDRQTVGVRVPLDTLEKYAALEEEYTYPVPLGGIGLVQMRVPMINNVDGGKDGVSVYSAAVGVIRRINENEEQLAGEFERGKSRVFASDDLLRYSGPDSEKKLIDTLFVNLDGGPDDAPITIFSPELRDESYKRRRDGYLRTVESIIGLQRGILSDVQEQERTATEITSSKGDYALTVADLQEVWTDAVKEAMRLCGILGQLYRVQGAHEVPEDGYSIDYGDGILYDPDKEGEARLRQVQAGLLQPERYLGWYYNLPAETAAQRRKIRKDYMPEVLEDDGDE